MAPGGDGNLPEVLKCAKGTLIKNLHEHLCQCWRERSVPQDIRDSNIITLYKNKGDRSDCSNYCTVLAERVYLESQCGFRAKRSILRRILGISWRDHVTNSTVLERVVPYVFAILNRNTCAGWVIASTWWMAAFWRTVSMEDWLLYWSNEDEDKEVVLIGGVPLWCLTFHDLPPCCLIFLLLLNNNYI